MEENQLYTIILRHDTSTNWMINDPVLALGEYGVEDDTHRVKRGDGQSSWSELTYDHFGFEYAITFENLKGDIEDNKQLKEKFYETVSKDQFEDVDNKIISAINVTSEDGVIGKITRVQKDVVTNNTINTNLIIKSSDNSVSGAWSIDSNGVSILNLQAKTSIEEYSVGHRYLKDQLCYYGDELLRAKGTVTAEATVDYSMWEIVASTKSKNISYNNATTNLTATNVQDAIDETVGLLDTRVEKVSTKNKLYGTDNEGNQTTIGIEEIGTVDSVNGVKADSNKNITINGTQIKYNGEQNSLSLADKIDTKADITYVDTEVDKKVDRTIGDTIVTDVKLTTTLDRPTLNITKADTTSNRETEVALHVDTIGDITATVQNDSLILDTSATDTKIEEVRDSIGDITGEVQDKFTEIDTTIGIIQDDVDDLKSKITISTQDLEDKLDREVAELDTRIDNVNSSINTLDEKIGDNKADIEDLQTANQTQDEKINTINSNIATINSTIEDIQDKDTTQDGLIQQNATAITNLTNSTSEDIEDINTELEKQAEDIATNKTSIDTINENIDTINNTITTIQAKDTTQDTRLTTLEGNVEDIDQDISDIEDEISSIKTKNTEQDEDIQAAQDTADSAVAKNITQDTAIEALQDKDTAIDARIDSVVTDVNTKVTAINTKNTEQDGRLTTIEGNIATINTNISNINDKDSEQDTEITNIKTSITSLSEDINSELDTIKTKNTTQDNRLDGIDTSITTIEGNITTLQNTDTSLSTRITNNATAISNLTDVVTANKQSVDSSIEDINEKDEEQDGRLDNIDESITSINNDITTLNQKDIENENKINAALQDIEDLDEKVQGELQDIQDIAADQATMIEAIDGSIETINGSIRNINATNTEQDRNITNLNKRVTDNITRIDEDIADIQEVDLTQTSAIASNTAAITDLNSSVSTLTTTITNINAVNARIQAQMDGMVDELTTATETNNTQDTRLDGIDDSIEDIYSKLTESGQDTDGKFEEVEEEIAAINTHLTTTDGNVTQNTADIATNTSNIQQNATDIATNASAITALQTRATEDEQDIATNTSNIASNASAISDLNTNKLDKTFASNVDNKLVSNIKLKETTGTDIVILEQSKLGIPGGAVTTNQIKLTSKDNTLVAKPTYDENNNLVSIDLATNLDIDVNYFIYQDLLNPTIAAVNSLDINKITPITKEGIELEDIISDNEGTWARVQSIDTDNEIVTAITYAKHAQATWGTIKGNITDQQDLQDEFNTKVNTADISTNVQSLQGVEYDYDLTNNTAKTVFSGINGIATGATNYSTLLNTSSKDNSIVVDALSSTSTLYLNVNSENVGFDPKTSGITSTKVSSAIRELKGLDDLKVTTSDFETFKTQNTSTINTLETTLRTDLGQDITDGDTTLNTKIDTEVAALEQSITNVDNAKVDKAQGVANVGKHLIVNSEGNVDLETLDLSGYVELVTSDYGLVDNTDTQNPKILHDDSKLNVSFSDKYLRTFGIQANNQQGVLEASTRNVSDGQDVINTVDIVGENGISVTSAYNEDTENDTITIDASTLSTNITNLQSNKLDKQTTSNTVYTVDENGNQTNTPIADFTNIETVNGRTPDNNKNVQVDATVMYVDDTTQTKVTVKDEIDTKLTKVNTSDVYYGTNAKGEQRTYTVIDGFVNDNVISTTKTDTLNVKLSKTDKEGVVTSTDTKIVSNRQDVTFGTNEGELTVSVNPENITFDPDESGLQSVKVSNAIRELKGLDDLKVTTADFNTFSSQTASTITNNYNTLDTKVDNTRSDLEDSIEEEVSTLNTTITTKETAMNTKVDTLETTLTTAIGTVESDLTTAINNVDDAKVNKTTTANQIYATDANGNQTTFNKDLLGAINTVNNVTADQDNIHNITITANDINYITGTTIKGKLDSLDTNKVDKITTANKVYITDNAGEQTGKDINDFGCVDTVNGVSIDANKNVDIDADDIYIDKDATTKQTINQALETKLNKTLFTGIAKDLSIDKGTGNTVKVEWTDTDYENETTQSKTILSNDNSITYNKSGNNFSLIVNSENVAFDPSTSGITSTQLADAIRELKTLNDTLVTQMLTRPEVLEYTANTTYTVGTLVYIERDDGITLMGRVKQQFTPTTAGSTLVEDYRLDVEDGKISMIGIPLDWNETVTQQQEEETESEETQTAPGE